MELEDLRLRSKRVRAEAAAERGEAMETRGTNEALLQYARETLVGQGRAERDSEPQVGADPTRVDNPKTQR